MKRKTSSTPSADFGSRAYRGFWIGATLTGQIFIEKDNHLICWAPSVSAAMRIIDELVGAL